MKDIWEPYDSFLFICSFYPQTFLTHTILMKLAHTLHVKWLGIWSRNDRLYFQVWRLRCHRCSICISSVLIFTMNGSCVSGKHFKQSNLWSYRQFVLTSKTGTYWNSINRMAFTYHTACFVVAFGFAVKNFGSEVVLESCPNVSTWPHCRQGSISHSVVVLLSLVCALFFT